MQKLEKVYATSIEVVEIDILRGKANNLLKTATRSRILKQVTEGKFDMIFASPPCGTLSRARRTSDGGPPPLR